MVLRKHVSESANVILHPHVLPGCREALYKCSRYFHNAKRTSFEIWHLFSSRIRTFDQMIHSIHKYHYYATLLSIKLPQEVILYFGDFTIQSYYMNYN